MSTNELERCFFCAYAKGEGHNINCPIGLPSKHHYKIIWWNAYLNGLAGKEEANTFTDMKDRDTHSMGWLAGHEAQYA